MRLLNKILINSRTIHHLCRYHCSTSSALQTAESLGNLSANQKIKQLYSWKEAGNLSDTEREEIVVSAFAIFDQIKGPRNHFILNALLRICSDLNCPQNTLLLWKDIESLHQKKKKCKDLSYSFLLKNCVKSDDIPITKCIEVLNWMKRSKYKLKTQNELIVQLIAKCNDLHSVQTVHSMLNEDFIKYQRNDIYVATALINAFGTHRDIKSARCIFNAVDSSKMDLFCINAMLQALTHNDCNSEAINLFNLHHDHLIDDTIALGWILRAHSNCGIIANEELIESALKYCDDLKISTNLIEYYGSIGDIERANDIMDKLLTRSHGDTVSIGAMMKMHLNHGEIEQVLKLYNDIPSDQRDDGCHIMAIKACTKCNDLNTAKNALSELMTTWNDSIGISVKNALIEMHGTFGNIDAAEDLYHSIDGQSHRTQNVSTNTLMKAMVDNGFDEKALALYDQMESMGMIRDEISHIVAIRACGNTLDVDRGMRIHSGIALQSDCIQIKTALITFYGQCQDVPNALNVFQSITDDQQTMITIGSMMDAFCRNNYNSHCLDLFKVMETKYKVTPNLICYGIALRACSNGGAYYFGSEIERKLKALNEHDISLQIHLINLYGKCGMVEMARNRFESAMTSNDINSQNIHLWNAMVNVYGRNGMLDEAQCLFETMKHSVGVISDSFAILLSGCSHRGEVEMAQQIWNDIEDEQIKYDCYVMTSLVDGLARNGLLDEAKQFLQRYESFGDNKADHVMYMSLLSGCNKFEDKVMAQWVHDKFIQHFGSNKVLRRKLAAASSLLSNVNAPNRRKSEYSEIDLFGNLHTFYAGNKNEEHRVAEEYLQEILETIKKMGYVVDESDGTDGRSERLALVYGLRNSPKDYQIVINKNSELSDNSCSFMEFVSKLEQRSIIVSDKNRVYSFTVFKL